MRLFVALEPPEEVRDALRQRWEAAGPGADGWRWTPREQWHLTLAFLGEVDERRVEDLEARLGRAARRARPLQLELAEPGAFSRPAAARVLWNGLRGDVAPVQLLAAATTAAARRARCPVDERPLLPHVTMARSREVRDARPALGAVAAGPAATWQVDQMHLVCSRLGPAFARHERRRSWRLGPAAGTGPEPEGTTEPGAQPRSRQA